MSGFNFKKSIKAFFSNRESIFRKRHFYKALQLAVVAGVGISTLNFGHRIFTDTETRTLFEMAIDRRSEVVDIQKIMGKPSIPQHNAATRAEHCFASNNSDFYSRVSSVLGHDPSDSVVAITHTFPNEEEYWSRMGMLPPLNTPREERAFFLGSGVIIDDADSQGNRRLLTSAHVIDFAAGRSGSINIINSRGESLGSVRIVARADEGTARFVASNDMAVLETTTVVPEELEKLRDIRGLRLAPVQLPGTISGWSGLQGTGGVQNGISGGPTLNERGEIIGINHGGLLPRGNDEVSVGNRLRPALLRASNVSGLEEAEQTVAGRRPLLLSPVSDPRILAALGSAGRGIRTKRTIAETFSVLSPETPVEGLSIGYDNMGCTQSLGVFRSGFNFFRSGFEEILTRDVETHPIHYSPR